MEQDTEEVVIVHQDTVLTEDTETIVVTTVLEIARETDTGREIAVLASEITIVSGAGAGSVMRSTGNITKTATDTGSGTGTETGREEMIEIVIPGLPRPE